MILHQQLMSTTVRTNGKIMQFFEHKSGLYLHDLKAYKRNKESNKEKMIFIQTVAENESEFNKRDLKKAKIAQLLHRRMGRPGYKNLMAMLDKNQIRDCPITSEDLKRALYIYGPDIALMKGKTTRIQPPHIPTKHWN